MDQQTAFMASPPPCGKAVSFLIDQSGDGHAGALFMFDARDVQAMAEEMIESDPQMIGLRAAAKWTSRCSQEIESPTPVPSILTTFDQLAFKLIESGKGWVRCMACDQVYGATDLIEGHFRVGGYCLTSYSCPKEHKLIQNLVMHVLLRRHDEDDLAG